MRLIVVLTLVVLGLPACVGDGAAATGDAPRTGRWELREATRNNVPTGVVDGLYFEFNEDGTLETNLMRNEAPGTYAWTEDRITTAGIKLPLEFSVREHTDSTLHLRSDYRGFQFDFMLVR